MNTNEKLQLAYNSLRKQIDLVPKIAIVCGTGLGGIAGEIQEKTIIPYEQIAGMPISTIEGHAGNFIFGYSNEVPIVVMQGRVHMYEGYTAQDAVLPIRLMKMLGTEIIIISNASGGITWAKPGTIMLIKDQISSMVPSPLIGPNINELGPRFPDMSEIYNEHLREIVKEAAKELNMDIKEGVYMQFMGPQYESPAEIQLAKTLGADAVGMSTCIEAIAANHMGMKIIGISCISNGAAGITKEKLDHISVKNNMHLATKGIAGLVSLVIEKIKRENKW